MAVDLLLILAPLRAWADAPAALSPTLAPIIITEVQPGSATSASEEFIELYNTTTPRSRLIWRQPVATRTSQYYSYHLDVTAAHHSAHRHACGEQSYVVASQFTSSGQTEQYVPSVASVWFSAGISAAAGHVRLTYTTNQIQSDTTCSGSETVDDEVEWSAPKSGQPAQPATPSLDGRSVFITAKSSGIAAGSSLQRQTDQTTTHNYIDTNTDAVDFAVSTQPSPGALNAVSLATPPVNTAPVTPLPGRWL